MINISEVLSLKNCVHVYFATNEKEILQRFLIACDNRNITWNSGEKASEWDWIKQRDGDITLFVKDDKHLFKSDGNTARNSILARDIIFEKYTLSDFKNKKIGIVFESVDSEGLVEFLSALDKECYVWGFNTNISASKYINFPSYRFCIVCGYRNEGDNTLAFASGDSFFKQYGYAYVPIDELQLSFEENKRSLLARFLLGV